MGSGKTIPALIAVCAAALASCNTTDALTPPADIGDASVSTPVTQRDVERIAAAPVQPVYSSQTQESYQSTYREQAYASTGSSSATLDEQANAIRNGQANPFASKPIDNGYAQPSADSGMPTRSDEQREANRRLSDPQPHPPAQAQQADGDDQQQPAPQQQASLPAADAGTVRFLPIIGAPVETVTPLSRQLGAEARAHGLTIKGSSDPDSAYILKGYLSAFADGPSITVSYVWDVLDSGGNRLHRIQGTEAVPQRAGDPWAAVPASVMQKIGTKTIGEFDSWRQQRGG